MSSAARMSKAQQREATIARLITIARAAFAAHGYAAAATEEIVAQAGVTRGALYHHFGSKEGLFLAVVGAVQADVGERVEAAAAAHADPWDQLIAGCSAFLTASRDAEVQRIMLIDAPAVLGWSAWRALDAQHSMAALRAILTELQAAGTIAPLPLDALTHLLSGAMNEASLWLASSPYPRALDDAIATLTHLLTGLRQV